MLYLLSIFYIYEKKRKNLEREGDGKLDKKGEIQIKKDKKKKQKTKNGRTGLEGDKMEKKK